MKRLPLLLFCISALLPVQTTGQSSTGFKRFFTQSDLFFKSHVIDGRVDYDTLHKQPAQLRDLLQHSAEFDTDGLSPQVVKAFWINAYNILVIKGVVDHYPIRSPMDVPGFFDRITYRAAGRDLTLNQIENDIIRKQFPDAGIHFVLVCAAVSCPRIVPRAYHPERLAHQIEKRIRATLMDPGFIRILPAENTVQISEIFRWYKDDFLREADSIRTYINRYRTDPLPDDFTIKYYTYDWSLNGAKKKPVPDDSQSNLRAYTPSKLLNKSQIEVKFFNNLYTQTAYRDENGERIEEGARTTYYTGLIQVLYGLSESARFNIGFDVNLKSVYRDEDPRSSFLKVFQLADGENAQTAVATFGPKIKVSPFISLPFFSIQSAFWFPGRSDLEGSESGRPFLEFDRYSWFTQLFWDQPLGDDLQLFLEADLMVRFDKGFDLGETRLFTPLSLFLSYFIGSRATLYTMAQYAPTLTSASTYYAQAGFGGKYQITRDLEIEIMWTHFFASANAGAGSTYNLGIRYLR